MNLDATTETAAVFGDPTPPSLTVGCVVVHMAEPTGVTVGLACPDNRLFTSGELQRGGLASRHILPGDLLIFDRGRTRPKDGDLVMVQDGRDWPIRIYRAMPHGHEYHTDDPADLLTGERRVHGTVVAIVRVDGEMEGGRL